MNYLEEAINKLQQGVYYTPVSVINKIKKEFSCHFFFKKIDIRNKKQLFNFFNKNKKDIIIHLEKKNEKEKNFKKKNYIKA